MVAVNMLSTSSRSRRDAVVAQAIAPEERAVLVERQQVVARSRAPAQRQLLVAEHLRRVHRDVPARIQRLAGACELDVARRGLGRDQPAPRVGQVRTSALRK